MSKLLQNDLSAENVGKLKPLRSRKLTAAPDWSGMALSSFQSTEMPVYTAQMNDITREEFNAKLETIEVKMDARVESVSAKIDAFIAVQVERDKRMEAIVSQISTTHAEIKTSINSMKTTTIVTAVSAVLAIVIGIAGFNAMLTSNMIASFQMGRSESALATSATQSSQKAEPVPPSSAQKK
ncbi:hypothetical protein [Pseudomonas fragi]|nr:hypothetical protein [Pseudomonas fragi]